MSTFLITGSSSGFGLTLSMEALSRGHKVIGTARNVAKAKSAHPQFEKAGGEWISLDVTSKDTTSIVDKVVREKRVDVIVNNAGYAALGAAEAFSDEEVQAQFDTNFFGALRVTRGALPGLREQKKGTIVNISSYLGYENCASCSIYGASKFALEGYSEALAQEVAPWNIRILIVQPGAFRTNFLGAFAGASAGISGDYQGTPADVMYKALNDANGKQPGDPVKGAKHILDAITVTGTAEGMGGFIRAPIGEDSWEVCRTKAKKALENFVKMEKVTRGTDCDDVGR